MIGIFHLMIIDNIFVVKKMGQVSIGKSNEMYVHTKSSL